ncbi:unnamed protein product, partial [Adineta ricciae]
MSNENQFQIQYFINQICSCEQVSPKLIVKTQSIISDPEYVKACLESTLNDLSENAQLMSDVDLLVFYIKHWKNYRLMCDALYASCLSLNLRRIQYNYSQEEKQIENISVTSQRIWEKILIKSLFSRVTKACLNAIDEHRNNRLNLDPNIINDVLNIYSDENLYKLIKQDKINRTITDIYIDCFESQYLQNAQKFFSDRKNHLRAGEIIEYLISISNYLHNELTFARRYLPEERSTFSDLTDILEHLFFFGNIFHNVWNDLELLAEQENHFQIANFYKAINQVPRIKNVVVELIETEFYHSGR